jgi:hypothetical protein
MAQAPVTIKLPGCGGEAVLRSFVKNKDRKAIRRIALKGTEVAPEDLDGLEEGKVKIKMAGENMVAVTTEQVRRLLISYDGVSENPYDAMLDSEYEEDMEAVEAAAQRIFEKGGDAKAAEKKSKDGA